MQDAPSADELLEALAELLTDRISPLVDDSITQFEIRVAQNTIGILRREFELADEVDAREIVRLQEMLGVAADARRELPLSRKARRAELDKLNRSLIERICMRDPPEGLRAHLIQTEIDRLSIVNPSYLDRVSDLIAAVEPASTERTEPISTVSR